MSTPGSTRRLLGAVLATAVVTAIGTVAFANHADWHTVYKGKAPNRTIVVTGEDETHLFNDEWTNVQGARATIRVPDGGRALLLIRFTAETVCYSNAPDACAARVMVDGRQAKPASGTDFHMDSYYANETDESEKAHAFDRSLEVGPGKYTVRVQGRPMGGTAFDVDDWSLTVERVRV